MSFFDSLGRLASEVEKALKGQPDLALKLKSCKACNFYQNGYCKQTSPPTKILSEYYAQGCIYYTVEEAVTGLLSKAEREAGVASKLDHIEKVDELTLLKTLEKLEQIVEILNIKVVEVIKKIEKIEEITSIRDLTLRPKSFIVNSNFEQDFVGWYVSGTAEISSIDGVKSQKCLLFPDTTAGYVYQNFYIPLGIDWLTDFYFYLKSASTAEELVRVHYYYTDGNDSEEIFQVAVANTWEKKVLSPTAGKYIETMVFEHLIGRPICKVDAVTTVFSTCVGVCV